jgi:hypothetical protein
MKYIYYGLNVIFLPIVATYGCYVNFIENRLETSLVLAMLSIFSVVNYLKAFGEPIERAKGQDYQDQYINQALTKCDALEQEVHELKIRIEEFS